MAQSRKKMPRFFVNNAAHAKNGIILKTRCKTNQQTSHRQTTRRTVHQLDTDQALTSTDETFKGKGVALQNKKFKKM